MYAILLAAVHSVVASEPAHQAIEAATTRPQLSHHAYWAMAMIAAIAALFLAAAIVGPLMPEKEQPQPDPSHGHDAHGEHH